MIKAMKLQFKIQPFQTKAVNSVVDCFAGQPWSKGKSKLQDDSGNMVDSIVEGISNADLELAEEKVLESIRRVQREQNLSLSNSLYDYSTFSSDGTSSPAQNSYKAKLLAATKYHLDVEMETGTGKTYCYTKTIFELNKLYGWSKFIIIVPSIAIREGVYKSLQITADHFTEYYGKKARCILYNSKHIPDLESYTSDAGINVMVINIQAFNSQSASNRLIYEELDKFQSRKPIDVIASTRPILILDEPQKMGGNATLDALPKFNPLFILRYSATHKFRHNLIHRLDSLDAFNQKLVKKISVCGIHTREKTGTQAYLYLENFDISNNAPKAKIELEVKLNNGKIVRKSRKLKLGDDLYVKSGSLEIYRGYRINQLDADTGEVKFANGIILERGEAFGDALEVDIRRIQIREAIKAHISRERKLYSKGIKILTLFFIDQVVKYRDYNKIDEKGLYARIFEEEYDQLKEELLSAPKTDDNGYWDYLESIDSSNTHSGYFSIDKKTKRIIDPRTKSEESRDVGAYELILRDKERLLSPNEPTRFIFSHSALREGWDNPNIFVICMLKNSDNTISRRQEVGRGLRLCVNKDGERIDDSGIVHDVNVLTVVSNESYNDFVKGLQTEIVETLTSRPRKANKEYFSGQLMVTDEGPVKITDTMANHILHFLIRMEYTDVHEQITEKYHQDRKEGNLQDLPEELKPYSNQVFQLIDSVFSEAVLPKVVDSRKLIDNPLNKNFKKKEFIELWERINKKAVYRVKFDSNELIKNCTSALDKKISSLDFHYIIETGEQESNKVKDNLQNNIHFRRTETETNPGKPIHSQASYDLIGKLASKSMLKRETVAKILNQIKPEIFAKFKTNPEQFISIASETLEEQKATTVIEHLKYNETSDKYDITIFTDNEQGQNSSRATKVEKHIYDYAITDSKGEKEFLKELDISSEIVVYAKLPSGFQIPTPVGNYTPDWAISFHKNKVKNIYFVAETKGSDSPMQLRDIESKKIECARKFFDCINSRIDNQPVKFDVVDDYQKLMEIVGPVNS